MRTLEKRCEISTAVLPRGELLEALEHLEFRARIERRGRLVEDQHLRVAHVGARDRDLLPLAAGQVDAGAKALADDLVVAARKRVDHFVGEASLRGLDDARTIVARLDASDRDVVGGSQVIAHEVLEDDADVGAQREQVVLAQVVAVEQDASLVGIVEARQELHQRGLAGAVLAHQRQHLARAQKEGQCRAPPSARRPDSGIRRRRTRSLRGSDWGTDADWPAMTISGSMSKNENRSSR